MTATIKESFTKQGLALAAAQVRAAHARALDELNAIPTEALVKLAGALGATLKYGQALASAEFRDAREKSGLTADGDGHFDRQGHEQEQAGTTEAERIVAMLPKDRNGKTIAPGMRVAWIGEMGDQVETAKVVAVSLFDAPIQVSTDQQHDTWLPGAVEVLP